MSNSRLDELIQKVQLEFEEAQERKKEVKEEKKVEGKEKQASEKEDKEEKGKEKEAKFSERFKRHFAEESKDGMDRMCKLEEAVKGQGESVAKILTMMENFSKK